MTKTRWREDFTEIVENRSVGYMKGEDNEWHMLMPFENVHDNGGPLTMVGDLLKFTTWTRAKSADLGGLAISLMCNAGGANSDRLAHEVADLYLADAISREPAVELAKADVDDGAGSHAYWWLSRPAERSLLEHRSRWRATLKVEGGLLIPVSATRFVSPDGVVTFDISRPVSRRRHDAHLPSQSGWRDHGERV